MKHLALLAVLAVNLVAAPCDRACLKAALDQYLNALVQHKPEAAPLAVAFRQTENAVVKINGSGLWQSTKALGKLQRKYFDTELEQAAFFGLIDEQTGRAIGLSG